MADSIYTAVTIRVKMQKNTVEGERMEQLYSRLSSHLRCNYKRILCCAQEKQLVLVLCDYTGTEKKDVLTYIFEHFCQELKEGETALFVWETRQKDFAGCIKVMRPQIRWQM